MAGNEQEYEGKLKEKMNDLLQYASVMEDTETFDPFEVRTAHEILTTPGRTQTLLCRAARRQRGWSGSPGIRRCAG